MAHNLHGDIPENHQELAKELEELEGYFDSKTDSFPPESMAKAYVCMASDWYSMGDDDKGSKLLDKAEKACPGYFNNQIHTHTYEDPDFDLLVKILTKNVLEIARSVLGYSNE